MRVDVSDCVVANTVFGVSQSIAFRGMRNFEAKMFSACTLVCGAAGQVKHQAVDFLWNILNLTVR